MAKRENVRKLREESRKMANKELRDLDKPLPPPRKAMSQARKLSKDRTYPVPPYPGVGLYALFRWVQQQWEELGRHQSLAAPVIVLVALLTWEKERQLQEARWFQLEKTETKQNAAEIYGAFGAGKKRKLLGIIPLP